MGWIVPGFGIKEINLLFVASSSRLLREKLHSTVNWVRNGGYNIPVSSGINMLTEDKIQGFKISVGGREDYSVTTLADVEVWQVIYS